jgi:hypothetical protein
MRAAHLITVLICLLIGVRATGQAESPAYEEAKLTASDAQAGDDFGYFVAYSEDTAVVGSPFDRNEGGINAGSAHVFVRDGATWTQQAKLVASDAAPGDWFGTSVAIDGDTIVVGAHHDDMPEAKDAGSAYVFVRTGTTWSEQAKIIAPDGEEDDEFGYSVALSGETAIVGAVTDNTAGGVSAGSAYVFVRSETRWTLQAKLRALDAMTGDGFGGSVSVSADTAVVGATKGETSGGAAYVFDREGAIWTQRASLTAFDASLSDEFGCSVSLSGDSLVVGSSSDDNDGGVNAGSAYVFVRTEMNWDLVATLTASDASSGDRFGTAVSISGDRVVVGAPHSDIAGAGNTGSAYMFMRSGSAWSQMQKLTPTDGALGDLFGQSVVLSADTLIVGAIFDDIGSAEDAGSAYAFRLSPEGDWTDLGLGLSASTGVPMLAGAGPLLAQLPVTLDLSQAKSVAFAPLVIGLSDLSAPFKGGVMVPSPNFIFPLFTNFFGEATFGGLWPPGVPSGFTTYFQWWISDPAGPQGYAASNAIAGTAL